MRGYAVIDVETTGATKTDRVVEIAVVLLDEHLKTTGTWETLVQPRRDVPNTRIHGITPGMLVHAPAFCDVAGHVREVLHERVVVTHNAQFGLRFLAHEFRELGLHFPAPGEWCVDTMVLARRSLNVTKMGDALRECSLEDKRDRTAISAAYATVDLLRYLSPEPVKDRLTLQLPALHRGDEAQPLPRTAVEDHTRNQWLERVSSSIPPSGGEVVAEYRAVLTEALTDLNVSLREQAPLWKVIRSEGLNRHDVEEIHELVLRQLAMEAWLDGTITADERRSIENIARALCVPNEIVDTLLIQQPHEGSQDATDVELTSGDRVAFTGVLTLAREEWEKRARMAGLEVSDVKRSTHLLVAGDPASQSPKARKARVLGIPVISELEFARALGRLPSPFDTGKYDVVSAPEDHNDLDNVDGLGDLYASTEPPQDVDPDNWGSVYVTDPEDSFSLAEIFPWMSEHSPGSTSSSSIATEWIARYPSTPLWQLSPVLCQDLVIETDHIHRRSFALWREAHTPMLDASVNDLLALSGIGRIKAHAMVTAVVLAALDGHGSEVYKEHQPEVSPLVDGIYETKHAQMPESAVIGWLHLTTTNLPASTDIPAALRASADKLGLGQDPAHALDELFRTAEEEFVALAKGDERSTAIILDRWCGSATLEEVGTRFNVSRERIRQLETQLKHRRQEANLLIDDIAHAISHRFPPLVRISDLKKDLPALGNSSDRLSISRLGFMAVTTKQFEFNGSWLQRTGLIDDFRAALEDVDEHGLMSLADLSSVLGIEDSILDEWIRDTLPSGVLVIDDSVATIVGSHADRGVSVLALAGEPLSEEEIARTLGVETTRSMSNAYASDARLVRANAQQWALSEWGTITYTNIADWIGTQVDANDGAVALEDLVEKADELKVSASSIRAYASSGEFELHEGNVRRRTEFEPLDADPRDTRDFYKVGGQWRLLSTVNSEHLRGSGVPLPRAAASLYGVTFAEPVELDSPLGPQSIRLGRSGQVTTATVRRFLSSLKADKGDRVWLHFNDDHTFDVSRAPASRETDEPMGRILDALGCDQDPETVGRGGLLRLVNEYLGFESDAPRRRAVAAFNRRGQDDIAEALRAL